MILSRLFRSVTKSGRGRSVRRSVRRSVKKSGRGRSVRRSVRRSVKKSGGRKKIYHTPRGLKQDKRRRSTQAWERGRGAPRKSNPRYAPKQVTAKPGYKMKVYTLRKKSSKK